MKKLSEKVIETSLLALAASFLFVLALTVGTGLFVGLSALGGFILFLAWNQAIHSFLYGPSITFTQAWGLSVMVGLVTGNLKNMFERMVGAIRKAYDEGKKA